MKRTWTIIGVADVARSFRWYQSLFGQPETPPAHQCTLGGLMWRPWIPVAPDLHAPGYDQWVEQQRRAKGVAPNPPPLGFPPPQSK